MKPRDKIVGPMSAEDGPPVLRCWACDGGTRPRLFNSKCFKCDGTGAVFWADGRAFPYTPEGEKRALSATAQKS